jgi:hypothetical protein
MHAPQFTFAMIDDDETSLENFSNAPTLVGE